MIVDDEPFNILGLKQLLRQLGPKNLKNVIDSGKNGLEAL